jgi:glycosyltransferase involved in cell wall biosynthesis
MQVVVDHSIAHPVFMDRQLRDEYKKNCTPFDLGMDSKFWQGVLKDCDKADILQVNSNFVKDTFVEQGYDVKKIRVIYQGVRKDFFSLKQNYEATDKIKILFTGSFGFRKGGEYILKAMQELEKQNFACEMIVVGSYIGAESLIANNKASNVRFVGHVLQDELKNYLLNSDVYLFPSLSEGCASSGMEAMAAGLPVIATVESGLPIENGKNGIIIPSKDVNAIVDAIIKLKDDKELREKLGAAAANTISANYTWEQYAHKVIDLYNSLLNSN